MAILIDPPRPEAHGRRWSHLVSDTSLDELHRFARSVGIPERGFEGDHYDIPEERYASVVAAGARPTPARDLLRALQASGLRMQKRRGDKGVARVRGIRFADGTTADVDLIRSDREADEARVFAAMAFVQDDAGDFAVVFSVRRGQWGSPGGWREPGESVRENAVREIREETGLVVAGDALRPRGYERFHRRSVGRPVAGGARPPPGVPGAGAGSAPGPHHRARRHLRPPVDDLGRARARVLRPVLVGAGRRGAQPARRVISRARFSRADGSHSARAWAVRYTWSRTRNGRSTSVRAAA